MRRHKNINEEEARDLLKKYKEHLVKAKLERNYYNKNTKLAGRQRKLVNERFITRGKADYCSVDATTHYSYDWAQNVHVPHAFMTAFHLLQERLANFDQCCQHCLPPIWLCKIETSSQPICSWPPFNHN